MEQLKSKILELLNENVSYFHTRGSAGELGDPVEALNKEDFIIFTDELLQVIQAVFDSENQPNQFNIENPFSDKNDDFEKSILPAINYLVKNHHPHTKILVDYDRAELLEGIKATKRHVV